MHPPARSYRLAVADLGALARIADHLAMKDRHAPNQTKALSWAIAQGLAAVEAEEREASDIPEGLHDQVKGAAALLQSLAVTWERAAWKAGERERAHSRRDAELERLRERVLGLEADLERARAAPYSPPVVAEEEDRPESAAV